MIELNIGNGEANDVLSFSVQPVNLKSWKFPAGETGIRIDDISSNPTFINNSKLTFFFKVKFRSNDDLINLLLLKDAVGRLCISHQKSYRAFLYISYFPYARQDRAVVCGESASLKTIADFINGMNFDVVRVDDPHSYVVENTLNNCLTRPQYELAFELLFHNVKTVVYDVVIAPDAGAEKKAYEFYKRLLIRAAAYSQKAVLLVVCNKTRDAAGNIVGYHVPNFETTGKRILVLDDICDGGRTFVELAKAIKEKPNGQDCTLDLYVTHGIFSQGVSKLLTMYENIYCYNLMNDSEEVTSVVDRHKG